MVGTGLQVRAKLSQLSITSTSLNKKEVIANYKYTSQNSRPIPQGRAESIILLHNGELKRALDHASASDWNYGLEKETRSHMLKFALIAIN